MSGRQTEIAQIGRASPPYLVVDTVSGNDITLRRSLEFWEVITAHPYRTVRSLATFLLIANPPGSRRREEALKRRIDSNAGKAGISVE
ncbi:MAG: hypothetical protein QOJ99_2944 [Bryobacterales bacterium]|nr:hypothetical protein [Bryobacterales bacterium]